jgi:hypothetical protein
MIDVNNLSAVITVIIALAVATERLVEIIKGMVPWLDQEKLEARIEARRRAALQLLAAAGGILVTLLAWPVVRSLVPSTNQYSTIVALGLLASGGSGFWNAILSYVWNLKTLKSAEVERARRGEEGQRPLPQPREGVLKP